MPLGRKKVVLQSEIAGAIVDLVLNLILIPRYAAAGAAFGTLAAEAVVLAVQYQALKRDVEKFFSSFSYSKVVIAVICAAVSSVWIKMLSFNSFISLVISAACFFCVYGGIMFFFRDPLLLEIFEEGRKKAREILARRSS